MLVKVVPWFIQPNAWAPENEEIILALENYDLKLETIEKINGMAKVLTIQKPRVYLIALREGQFVL